MLLQAVFATQRFNGQERVNSLSGEVACLRSAGRTGNTAILKTNGGHPHRRDRPARDKAAEAAMIGHCRPQDAQRAQLNAARPRYRFRTRSNLFFQAMQPVGV